MKILAFETATPSGGVALLTGERFVGQITISQTASHSLYALRFAEELLASAKLEWSDLDAVAASHGPGSFVGVRIALTLLKGIAWSHKLQAVTVSTLEALAIGAWSGEQVDCIVPLVDARAKEVYGAVFRIGVGGVLVRVGDDFCAPPDDIAARIRGRALFAGEGAVAYHASHLKHLGVLARPDRRLMNPASVAELARQKLLRNEATSAAEVAAVYLREATVTRPKE